MKCKLVSIVLVVIMLLGLTACNSNRSDNKNGIPDVDLSMYSDHGEWSCGRIWVKKTEESWDSSNTYVGYLDENGNLVGEWHSVSAWPKPNDFANDFAFVGTGEYEYSWNSSTIVSYDVINLKGEIVFTIECIAGSDGYEDAAVKQFNSHGYAFYIEGYYKDTYVKSGNAYMLCKDGSKVKIDERLELNGARLNNFSGSFSEGYMSYSNEAYINEEGQVALDFSDRLEGYFGQRYTITNLYPIEDGLAKVVFEGKDDKKYFIVVDIYGNLLTEQPISYDKFSNFDFSSIKRVDNLRVSSLNKSDIKDGAVVKFGNYEQDNVTSNGPELIEWIVLRNDGNKALLVSKYVLDACDYAAQMKYSKTANWENSVVRAWLNNDFFNAAFSKDEIGYIIPSSIESKVITYTGVYDNENLEEDIESRDIATVTTTDNVFLLSVDEIKNLMVVDEIIGQGTKYSSEKVDPVWYNGKLSKPYYKWMTRDLLAHNSFSGNYSKQVFSFEGQGEKIYNYEQWDDIYRYDIDGVRPAIYIDLNKIK